MYKPRENIALYITVILISAFTVIVCIFYSGTISADLRLDLNYYFVYQYVADDAVSASSLSSSCESAGGAGYILFYNSRYYIIVSCYYDETSARSVCFNLKTLGMECGVLAVSVTEKPISRANLSNAELFSGNINTLSQLGKIAYALANDLDTGEITQNGAREVLGSALTALNGLLSANAENCFSGYLSDIITICGEIFDDNYIYSKNTRKLQIAIIACIINIKLI